MALLSTANKKLFIWVSCFQPLAIIAVITDLKEKKVLQYDLIVFINETFFFGPERNVNR